MRFSNIFVLLIIISCFYSLGLISISTGQDEYYSLSITEKDYDFIKKEDIKGRTFEYYNIKIVITNSENSISDDITVEIEGEDGLSETLNYTIPAQGSREFLFSNFFIEGEKQHQINISYYPTSKSVHERNEDNSGFSTIIIKLSTGSNESTPGFELILMIFSIIIYFIFRKNKFY